MLFLINLRKILNKTKNYLRNKFIYYIIYKTCFENYKKDKNIKQNFCYLHEQ